jgi:hypothetical protein
MSQLPVPDPCLEQVVNDTPYRHFDCDKMGPGRRFFDTVAVKGTFSFSTGTVELAEEQSPIALADEYWDPEEADRSSVRQVGDLLLYKPGCDILLTGTARSPGYQPAYEWQASVLVHRAGTPIVQARAAVFAPRYFRYHDRGWMLESGDAARDVPIRYELAYGGAQLRPMAHAAPEWQVYPRNPSGTGYFDWEALDERLDYAAPQWEAVGHPFSMRDRDIPLAGFGPVARSWEPRVDLAGTYDEAWESQMLRDVEAGLPADYPADFDPRFFHYAHPDLVTPTHLIGDEELVLDGLVGLQNAFAIRLPGIRLDARLRNGQGDEREQALALDTVHLDLDRALMHLTWRLTLDQQLDIRAATIKEVRL